MTFLIAAIAIWGTAEGTGPFVRHNPVHNVVLLQAFIAVLSVTGLFLAAFITERKHTEDVLQEQARLLDLANDAIFVCDLDGRVTYWNQGAERLYGWTRQEVLGKSIHELLGTEFPKPLAEINAHILRDGSWQGELIHSKRSGDRIVVDSRWSMWRSREGKLLGVWSSIPTSPNVGKPRIGQYLIATKIELDLISGLEQPVNADKLREPLEFVERAITETRTISHLLHPPFAR